MQKYNKLVSKNDNNNFFFCLRSFLLKEKNQKFKKRSSALTQADTAPATFSGQRAVLNPERCGGCQRKVRKHLLGTDAMAGACIDAEASLYYTCGG
jgi:hypothetical protein